MLRAEIKNVREKKSTEDRMRKSNICLIGISEEQREEEEAIVCRFSNWEI